MQKANVLTGLDNLKSVHDKLSGKRVGLMTHPCGFDKNLKSAIDVIHENYNLTALFACEHGIRGDMQAGDEVLNEVDRETGVPVFSMHGQIKMPTDEMMNEIDVMVIDLQDVGARFYTYLYSMANAMIASAKNNKPIVVLDRINPIGGEIVQGTLLDENFHSFVGEYAVPTRYGLTIGEFAHFVKDHLKLDIDLTVSKLTGWKREYLWTDTNSVWTPPSPNMPTPETALMYIGTCIFEGTNLSEGRGTTTPFELVGAPFIDAGKLEKRMRQFDLPGIAVLRASFTPTFSKWQGEMCSGVRIRALTGEADAFKAGLYLLETIRDMYPNDVKFLGTTALAGINLLLGTDDFREGRLDADGLIQKHLPLIQEFKQTKQKYHLY
ncbi:MAG: DUF1343 domain-containing protein [Clostridiales bacterium]|nr:DUF1343 domain-containing protein [Clostridiales bacterium]